MAARLTPDQLDTAIGLQKRQWTQARIAKEIGVCRETVSRSLARHNRRALGRLLKQIAAAKGQQVEQLGHISSEAMAAWEESRQDAEVLKTFEQTDKVEADDETKTTTRTKTETTIKAQSGDARLLDVALKAMADIRDILGIGKQGKEELQTLRDVWKEAGDALETYQPARPPSAPEGRQPQGAHPGVP